MKIVVTDAKTIADDVSFFEPLKELGELLDPPVGKSGVNHRLRKLSELAERLRVN